MKYVKCPRCDLNYMPETEKYCDVCKAELKLGPTMKFVSFGDDEDSDQILCPICKRNYIDPGEEMCAECKEEKSEKEPLKIWGRVVDGEIVPADGPNFTAQCLRVPVSDGHMAAVFVRFEKKPSKDEILEVWKNFRGRPQELELPHAPKQFLHYFTEDNMPQTKLQRELEGGMAVSIGRLREDTQYDYKFVCLSHNTLRGAAGGAVLAAELLCAEGYIEPKN